MAKKFKGQKGTRIPYKKTSKEGPLPENILKNFYLNPKRTVQNKFLNSFLQATSGVPYNAGSLPYLNKRYGDISNSANVGDISKRLKDQLYQSQFNLAGNRNLGKAGTLSYQNTLDKNSNLKKALDSRNFTYTNQFGNEGLRGNIAISPKNYTTGEFGVGQELGVKYDTRKDDQGRLNTVTGNFNPGGPFSMEYSQQYRPGSSIINQRATGNINTDGFTASGYRNINQEEGKTYGGSFAKTKGPITYGASANYGPQGLTNLNANLAAEDFYNLGYSRNRVGDGFENTVNAGFNFSPFNINYSRTYTPGQEGTQTIGGGYQGEKGSFDISKNLSGENAGTYTGSLSKKIGNLNLSASGSGTKNKVQDYKVNAALNIPTKKGKLDVTGSYGKTRDEMGNFGKGQYNVGLKYGYNFKKGGTFLKTKSKLKNSYFNKYKQNKLK